MELEDIRKHYRERREEIQNRLEEFESLRNADDRRLFKEFVFVILTSQTDAKKSWKAANKLDENKLLIDGSKEQVAEVLQNHEIQYEENKASYIVENRKKLSQPTLDDPSGDIKLSQKIDPGNLDATREWLVENMKGVGWKAASHFLRNIGYGNSFAIISSHILRNLQQLGAVETLDPPSSKEEYIELEEKMQQLASKVEVDIKALDLVLWSMETGEIFK